MASNTPIWIHLDSAGTRLFRLQYFGQVPPLLTSPRHPHHALAIEPVVLCRLTPFSLGGNCPISAHSSSVRPIRSPKDSSKKIRASHVNLFGHDGTQRENGLPSPVAWQWREYAQKIRAIGDLTGLFGLKRQVNSLKEAG